MVRRYSPGGRECLAALACSGTEVAGQRGAGLLFERQCPWPAPLVDRMDDVHVEVDVPKGQLGTVTDPAAGSIRSRMIAGVAELDEFVALAAGRAAPALKLGL